MDRHRRQEPLVPADSGSAHADVDHLAAVLHRRWEELAGGRARIGDGDVVHAVTDSIWAGVRVPAVLCRASADPLRLRAAEGQVTCRRCQRRLTGRSEDVPEGQMRLE
ncbi:hypothetical protein [Nocardiopsis halophila]|uniref:hypothetical protein n=1 Tax=Nocardiopsis halophila TaxID=141692 RepID=UPI00034B66A6|nr:hypothetical protein [Nocardiopsis halophila]